VDAHTVFDRSFLEAGPVDGGPVAGTWLELVATTAGMREHEALMAVKGRPSHIHQALLMVGLEAGAPLVARFVDGRLQTTGPEGPPVRVTVLVSRDGKQVEEPVETWLIDRRTGASPKHGPWLFTGSVFQQEAGSALYMADLNGTVVSLVNFGDDLLSRPTHRTPDNDEQAWTANLATVPPMGTAVTLRLTAMKANAGPGNGGPAR